MSERKYTLANLIVRSGGKLKYIHDPAAEKWMHETVVEDSSFSDPAWPFPVCCIAGVRACPPSGIGGVDGFAHLLRVLDGTAVDEELKARFANFQPDHFDLEAVNRTFGVDGPRHGSECMAQGCGQPKHLKTMDGFVLHPEAVSVSTAKFCSNAFRQRVKQLRTSMPTFQRCCRRN